ncbi:MAG: hypothetical protein M3Y17_05320 [Actinomycetota bacterium]|nr:hypothetical protein [Actinomycetota bacterium]
MLCPEADARPVNGPARALRLRPMLCRSDGLARALRRGPADTITDFAAPPA